MAAAGAQVMPDFASRRRKAAMVVQLLINDGQKIALSRLPEEVQINLTRELAALRLVDRETLHSVADEFARAVESVGIAAPGGVEGALAALGGQLSPEAQARLRREAAAARGGDPWTEVAALPAADLVRLMERESTEVAAVALSKLPVSRAAEVLGLLPGDRARRITYAMSQTAGIRPEAVARIGGALAADYTGRHETAFAVPPVARIGAILNSSEAATRDAVLESLAETDAGFADQVRRAIFTFADIPARVGRLDVPRVVRGIESADLVAALAHAQASGADQAAVAEYILANMSQRMAESLREELRERGSVRRKDGERAQNLLIAAIRERADSGEITLVVPEDDEDGA
ncbi:MAG: flagellar motor switch protein FliG [Rubellimicrobium sp.]|nr:flagellar motor switch protein FliG [Rubellimicrobium sp.]